MIKIWRSTWLDIFLVLLSIFQFFTMPVLALYWNNASFASKIVGFFLLIFMMTYNIIVVSHLFTHVPWFNSPRLNRLISIINSVNIGQSVQAYHLFHVRNHHKYNNDQKDSSGTTKDLSSTFQEGKKNEHATLFQYAFIGALKSLWKTMIHLLSAHRFWCVRKND